MKYFISYRATVEEGKGTFGRALVDLGLPIRGIKDIDYIEWLITDRSSRIKDCLVLFWRRFEE